MSVMPTTPGAWYQDRLLTVHDLEDMPDDEFRYELDDGVLIVSPAPSTAHQRAMTRLTVILSNACPPEFEVLSGPGINISEHQHRIPDIAVVRAGARGGMFLEEAPILAVEVASPRTKVYDLGHKKDVYQQFGIRSYWIVDLNEQRPSLTAFELRRGKYVQAGGAEGDQEFTAARPFPVTVVPSRLVAVPG